MRTVFGAELSLGLTRAAERRSPTRRATTCWCWPATPRGTAGSAGRSARPSWRREKGRPVYDLDELRRARTAATGWCSPAAARARCRAALVARPGPTRPPRSWTSWSAGSAATTWWSSCGTTATRSTAPATTRWPSWPAPPASASSPPATRTTPRPGRRRLATALAAVRARRSLDEMDGWLPAAGTAHLRSGAEMAARFARYPGAVERAAELGPRLRVRPAAGGAAAAGLRSRPGTTR